jgi:hypothetical protein
MSGRGHFFFRGERIRCPIFCITRSKGGRRASSGLSTKEERLSTRIFAARVSKIPLAVTTSICQFLADYFFRSEKKVTPAGHIAMIDFKLSI